MGNWGIGFREKKALKHREMGREFVGEDVDASESEVTGKG